MKFCLVSDLHLCFGDAEINNTENADVLIMAGDIYEFDDLVYKGEILETRFDQFFKHVSDQFPLVIWVPGNHEYWGTSPNKGLAKVKKYLADLYIENIFITNNQTIEVAGIPIHCATLWTDMDRGNPVIVQAVTNLMRDYKRIKVDIDSETRGPLWAKHTIAWHRESVRFLKSALTDDRPCVIVTHHAPLLKCSGQGSPASTYGYASDLSELILDNPHIRYWCYGHTHENEQIPMGDTTVVSNCRGYVGYEDTAEWTPIFLEVN